MLSVPNKVRVIVMSVVMLNVVMLNVEAPLRRPANDKHSTLLKHSLRKQLSHWQQLTNGLYSYPVNVINLKLFANTIA